MRLYSYVIVNLILSVIVIAILAAPASAECREKECMTHKSEFEEEGGLLHTFYYNKVFEIGTNWYIIFDYPSGKSSDTISFEFQSGLNKTHKYDSNKSTDSVSFSGSSFNREEFDFHINITVTGPEGIDGEFTILIHINKPPAEDMIYLWGGMTVFWVAIGAYTLYISNKFRDLSNKLGGYENGPRKKNE
tara:strand:+ start:288 stop:857 length:570 start_codon:yes stop_codon:yes gene_type:complete